MSLREYLTNKKVLLVLTALGGWVFLAGCRDKAGPSCDEPPQPAANAPAANALPPAPVEPFALGRPDVVLLVTGRSDGMLEVCNCAAAMRGGLSRRAGLVRSYRAAFDNVFLLDSGDAFHGISSSIRNGYILRAYRQIGYDAVVLGEQEWSVEPAKLGAMLASEPMPYLCTTILPPQAGWPVCSQVVKDVGPHKLAVLADVTEDALDFMDARVRQSVRHVKDDYAGRVRQLKQDGCVVVLVSHCPNGNLARAQSCGADLVIRGHASQCDEQVQDGQPTPVVAVGGHEMVGVIAMTLAEGRIDRMEYRLEPVDERWPADAEPMQTYQAYAHAEMRLAMDAQRVKGLQYVASSECGRCHARQLTAWQQSPHAKAYQTLQKADRTMDPNCLACHTTGFGTEKGFRTLQTTPQQAGVNCQDCHRFGIEEHRMQGFYAPKVKYATCTACHTPITDPSFDYETKLRKVRCPGG